MSQCRNHTNNSRCDRINQIRLKNILCLFYCLIIFNFYEKILLFFKIHFTERCIVDIARK